MGQYNASKSTKGLLFLLVRQAGRNQAVSKPRRCTVLTDFYE